MLTCDRLTLFAHWITPEVMPVRFDTHFFLTQAPEDHIGIHDGVESVDSVWITPKQAILEADSGNRTIIFPTRMNILKLGKYNSIESAIHSVTSESIVTVQPWLEERDGEMMLCIPEEAGYGITEEPLSKIMGNPSPS